MIENTCYNAYTEVYEILSYMPISYVQKIPNELLNLFEKKRNKEYKYNVDTKKKINEQDMLVKTKAILSTLYKEYWADSSTKEKILQKEEKERIEYQNALREKYNPENIFQTNNYSKETTQNKFNKTLNRNDTIEIYKDNFWKKIINKLKNIFKSK